LFAPCLALVLLLLSWLFVLLAARKIDPTAKIGITGQARFTRLTIEITTGAATARVTAPVAVLIICERSTIIYNTTRSCIAN
jgi:hypothetical protein